MKKKRESKGRFGEIQLGVSKSYVYPARRKRMMGAGALGGLVVLLVGAWGVVRDSEILSAGELSSSHATLEGSCFSCHEKYASFDDASCSACHEKYGDEVPVYGFATHYLYRAPHESGRKGLRGNEPSCFACHVEHRGREVGLTEVSDAVCLDCHVGKSFDGGHLAFSYEPGHDGDDPSLHKFRHLQHLPLIREEFDVERVETACLYCHQPEQDGRGFRPIDYALHCGACHANGSELSNANEMGGVRPLPIARSGVVGLLTLEMMESLEERGQPGLSWVHRSNPADYTVKDGKVRKRRVDHADPWVLENMRRLRATAYGSTDMADLLSSTGQAPPHEWERLYEEALAALEAQVADLLARPDADRAGVEDRKEHIRKIRREMRGRYATASERPYLAAFGGLARKPGVPDDRAQQIEDMAGKAAGPCRNCHLVRGATIVRVARGQRVLRRAEFDHRTHLALRDCLACHDKIGIGKEAADKEVFPDRVETQNLPGIDSCRECHTPSATSNRCTTCHRFHPNESRRSDLAFHME